jgi:aminoglycoside phosphotransferase
LEAGGVGLERLGELAVSDRGLDLAAAIGALLTTYGPEVLGHFVDAYGMERPPAVWLDFFTLLGELR